MESYQKENPNSLSRRFVVRRTSYPHHFSLTALTASKVCRHPVCHLGRLLLQEPEPVAEGLLVLATVAERGADREHATDEPRLHRDFVRATRRGSGDGHAIVNGSQQIELGSGRQHAQG